MFEKKNNIMRKMINYHLQILLTKYLNTENCYNLLTHILFSFNNLFNIKFVF